MAVDNPYANKLTVHILAAVAQHERELIAQRTSPPAAKACGKKLGDPPERAASRSVALRNSVVWTARLGLPGHQQKAESEHVSSALSTESGRCR